MSDDDRLIEVVREMERLAGVVTRLGEQVEGLSQDKVRELAAVTARSETEATIRGIMMSWSNLSESVGELKSDVHGSHGLERRLEEARLTLYGQRGDNGLRTTVRVMGVRARAAFAVTALLFAIAYGDKFGFYKLATVLGP